MPYKSGYIASIKKAMSLQAKKDLDYNSNGIELMDYFPFGDKSFIHEINKKALRMRSICGIEPECESMKDSLLDMINYCAYYYAYLGNKKVRGNKK
jgi:hypothetical protein